MVQPPYSISFFFSGFGTSPCGTETTAFSLAPGQSLTLNLQISIAYNPTNGTGPGGPVAVNPILYNGSCSSPTNCTESNSPFNFISPTESGAPETSGTFTKTYGARAPVTFTSYNMPTTPVPEGYRIVPSIRVAAASSLDPFLQSPTGTFTYLVDGSVVGTSSTSGVGGVTSAGNFHFSTAGLIPGTHTLTIEYSGDPVYAPSSYSQTFTVAPPAPGTSFVCETD